MCSIQAKNKLQQKVKKKIYIVFYNPKPQQTWKLFFGTYHQAEISNFCRVKDEIKMRETYY